VHTNPAASAQPAAIHVLLLLCGCCPLNCCAHGCNCGHTLQMLETRLAGESRAKADVQALLEREQQQWEATRRSMQADAKAQEDSWSAKVTAAPERPIALLALSRGPAWEGKQPCEHRMPSSTQQC
jgi:hypothetical protein